MALAAGEASGDSLGAGLIRALRAAAPDTELFGIAGPQMAEAGCEAWYRAEELSVMGFAEVVPHLPRLLRLRRELMTRIKAARPQVFVGIDSPQFNLPVAAALRAVGIATVQYVSPQVWAWRQSRVEKIRAAVDVVLCVLPFETAFYEAHRVNARFVGHPLADEIPLHVDRAAARARLGFEHGGRLVAILPGSRRAEVGRLAKPFMATACRLERALPDIRFAVALANDSLAGPFHAAARDVRPRTPPTFVTGRARDVMAAADVVLTASGTASLEALLLKRPMVVAYRFSRPTYWLVRGLGVGRLAHFSLPNLLAGRALVPEFAQDEVRDDVLGTALLRFLDGTVPDADWYDVFTSIHRELRRGASAQAAEAVLALVGQGAGTAFRK